MPKEANHQSPTLRAHCRRFRLDARGMQRLGAALRALEEQEEALRLALEHIGAQDADASSVRSAIKVLISGVDGSLR